MRDGQVEILDSQGPLLIEGPTDDSADATITMMYANRFLALSVADHVTIRNASLVMGEVTGGLGGAISATSSSLTLDNVAIGYSRSDLEGGGIFADDLETADTSAWSGAGP